MVRPAERATAQKIGRAAAWVRRQRAPLRITHHEIPWEGLSRVHTVVQISDVHVGWTTPESLLAEVIHEAHSQAPDITVLTGDYVNITRNHFPRVANFARALPSPLVAILGNHDHLVGGAASAACLVDAGATVLQNSSCQVRELTVVGVDDGFSAHDDVEISFSGVKNPRNTLVLTHYPPTADKIAPTGGRLILSGHTHGGQIQLPGRWLRKLMVSASLGRYIRGMHSLEHQVQLYVNAGLGHSWKGMRLGELCQPEVSVFHLLPI